MLEGFKKWSKKVLTSYRHLPDKKQYVEFFTALLSVPVLLTVILINLNNLTPKKSQTPTPTPTQQEKTIIVSLPPLGNSSGNNTQNNPTSQQCNKQLAPISILSPDEGDTVTDNPVSVSITYDQQDYCAVVWAYRINGGSWSDYGNDSLSLYNLPQGQIKLDLKEKSIVTGQEATQTRNFTYKGTGPTIEPSLSPTPNTGTSSAH